MDYRLDVNLEDYLKNRGICFKRASSEDLEEILKLYSDRTKWFKENKIKQWSKYLEHHPREEFEDIINNGYYFILKQDDIIVAGVEVSPDSKYWEDEITDAYYIYKLVTKVNTRNIGNIIIKICENIAINNNKRKLRLDCLKNNKKLNSIYENYGFKLIKIGYDNSYSYSLRQYEI